MPGSVEIASNAQVSTSLRRTAAEKQREKIRNEVARQGSGHGRGEREMVGSKIFMTALGIGKAREIQVNFSFPN